MAKKKLLLKAYGYARVSLDEEDGNNASISSQRNAIAAYGVVCSNDRVLALRDAILDLVHEHHDPDHYSYCTFEDLEDLEEEFDCSVVDEVRELVAAGKIWVPKPFGLVEWDTAILPVTWRPGLSTAEDITAAFGDPHLSATAEQGKVLTYDLYVENVDEGYPLPPAPYDVRNAQDEDRPEGYSFPYTGIRPPEALQIDRVRL